MPLLTKKTPVEPTFEERFAAAGAKAGAAISVFEALANDLEQAAVESAAIVSDIDSKIADLQAEVARLNELATDVDNAQYDNERAAEKIRNLFA